MAKPIRRGRTIVTALVTAALLAVAGCAGSGSGTGTGTGKAQDAAAGSAPQKLTLGITVAKSFGFMPAFVAEEKEFWKKRGLDVEIVTLNGNASWQQAFAAKSIDVGLGPAGPVAAGNSKGNDVKVVAETGKSLRIFVLFAKEGVNSPKDLVGKVVGVTSPGSQTEVLAKLLAKKEGGDVSAFKYANLGGFDQQVAALKTGQISAFVWTAEGAYEAEAAGLGKIIYTFDQLLPKYAFEIVAARGDVIKERRAAVQAFVDGLLEAITLVTTDKTLAVDVLTRRMAVTAAAGAKTYDGNVGNFNVTGVPDQEDLKAAIQSTIDSGALKEQPPFEQWVDFSFTGKK